jgi:hypothetical protein
MATSEQLDQLRQDLQSENDDLRTQLVDLRQSLQVNMPHHENEDNMDIIVNSHMRDITADNRPQMSGAGLEVNNKHFRDLSNHELHQIKKIHEKDHKQKPRTVLDENLGEIMDKCINFLTYSFDGYSKKYYEAEMMENVYDSDKSTYEMIKVHLIALTLFIRDDGNILYIGIMLIVVSMMMYLVNITTS